MEEIQQEVEERHPADTLIDGSTLKLVFWVPAFLLHTFIAVAVVMWVMNFAASSLWLIPFLARSMWLSAVYFYLGGIVAGLAWSPFLDRWLFRTSKYVWIIPTLWFVYWFGGWVIDMGWGAAFENFFSFHGRARGWLFTGATLPLFCSVAYTVGAWIRRGTGEEIPELVESTIGASTETISAEIAWARVVKLWRAGRSVDYADDRVKDVEETADSSLRSE